MIHLHALSLCVLLAMPVSDFAQERSRAYLSPGSHRAEILPFPVRIVPAAKTAVAFGQRRVVQEGRIDDLAAVDIDGDGRAEIITLDSTKDLVRIAYADRKSPLAESKTYSVPDLGGYIGGIADFTGDGKTDMLVSLFDHTGDCFAFLPGRGKGEFGKPKRIAIPKGCDGIFRFFRSGDLDGDGDLDALGLLYGISWLDKWVVIATNKGKGSFALKAYEIPRTCHGLAVGDLDGDGRAEFLIHDWDDDLIDVWHLDKGKYAIARSLSGVAHDLYLHDLDGDRRLDLIIGDDSNSWVCLGLPGGAFAPARALPEKNELLWGLAFGDIDADQRTDIIAADPDRIFYYRGAKRGRFISAKSIIDGYHFAPGIEDDGAQSLAFVDVNRDGKPDIVANHRFKYPWGATSTNLFMLINGGKTGNLNISNLRLDWAFMRGFVVAIKGSVDFTGSNIDLRFNPKGLDPAQSAHIRFYFSFRWANSTYSGNAYATGEFIHQPGSQSGTLFFDLSIPTNVTVLGGYPPITVGGFTLVDDRLIVSNSLN